MEHSLFGWSVSTLTSQQPNSWWLKIPQKAPTAQIRFRGPVQGFQWAEVKPCRQLAATPTCVPLSPLSKRGHAPNDANFKPINSRAIKTGYNHVYFFCKGLTVYEVWLAAGASAGRQKNCSVSDIFHVWPLKWIQFMKTNKTYIVLSQTDGTVSWRNCLPTETAGCHRGGLIPGHVSVLSSCSSFPEQRPCGQTAPCPYCVKLCLSWREKAQGPAECQVSLPHTSPHSSLQGRINPLTSLVSRSTESWNPILGAAERQRRLSGNKSRFHLYEEPL